MLFSYVWKGGYMTVATISDVSQSLLLLENSLKQTTVVTTEFLAKNAKNVYWSHLWIKCKGIFEGWITWKHPDVTVFLDFFDFFSSLFCFFWWKGIFSVIYPSVNVIWNVIFYESFSECVPAVNYTNSVLWNF